MKRENKSLITRAYDRGGKDTRNEIITALRACLDSSELRNYASLFFSGFKTAIELIEQSEIERNRIKDNSQTELKKER